MRLRFTADTSTADKKMEVLKNNEAFDEALRAIAKQALDNLQLLTPGTSLPNLWVAIEELGENGHIKAITIENTTEHQDILAYMELGTKPHVIDPKPENQIHRLVFFWEAINSVVFAKRVYHPGTIAYAMVESTVHMLNWQQSMWERIIGDKIKYKVDRIE